MEATLAYNGAGLFARLYNFVSDRNAAIKIRADRMDAEMDGFATGLSTCITKDGQTTVTAAIPFNNQRITGLADATASADALNRQTADVRYRAIGFGLTATVGSSALTLTLTNSDGTAISATAPVTARMRSATAATGSATARTMTAGPTLTVSSGSTLGTTSAAAFDLYVALFDDAGTVRLGVINNAGAQTSAVEGVASATSEGGAGAADSARVWYSNAAVTSKAYLIVGRLQFSSGQATAGTWATAPDAIDLGVQSTIDPNIMQGTAKAWANVNGTGTVAVRDSFNISSFVDNSVGNYTFNFSVAFPNANYSAQQNSRETSSVSVSGIAYDGSSASAFNAFTQNPAGGFVDAQYVSAAFFGDIP